MKKNILLGILLLILLFSYPTKLKYKNNNKTNIENTIITTVLNGRKFYSKEEKSTEISKEFHNKNSIQNPFDISKNKNNIHNSSRNSKGKIMISNDYYIISETKFD